MILGGPLWVKNGPDGLVRARPIYPRSTDIDRPARLVRFVPGADVAATHLAFEHRLFLCAGHTRYLSAFEGLDRAAWRACRRTARRSVDSNQGLLRRPQSRRVRSEERRVGKECR